MRNSRFAFFSCVVAIVVPLVVIAENASSNRINLEAFSVEHPSDPSWRSRHSPGRVVLGRVLDNNLHTFSLEAREYPPASVPVGNIYEVLGGYRYAVEKEAMNKGRFEITHHFERISLKRSMECIEYHKSWKDHGDEATSFNELTMVAHGLLCVHPDARERLIEVSYSVRNDSGIVPGDAQTEGSAFLASVRPLRRREQSNKTLELDAD